MSFNRLMYDTNTTINDDKQREGTLSYLLTPTKYYNPNRCRNEFGVVGGSEVSHIKDNLVDLESELMGRNRAATKNPHEQFLPIQGKRIVRPGIGTNQPTNLNISKIHLPSCQILYTNKTPYQK